MKDNKIILHELIHLDLPLEVAGLTNYGENLKEIPWSKNKFEFLPYCIFERKNGVVYYWYDKKGMDWKIKEAGKFDKEIMKKEVIDAYDEIKEIIVDEKALNLTELKKFLEKVKKAWTWLDCMWWMIEYYDKNKMPMEDILEVRKKTEYFIPGLIASIRKSIKKIPEINKEFIDVILIEEILSGKTPSEEILKRRKESYIFTNKRFYESFEKIEEDFRLKIEFEKQENKELKGQIAFKGKVIGIVNIIKNREDLKRFKINEILVASTTTPDFLPAMRKAGAIISEHGGAICHASITSRELKIPCIVGVKEATKILQEGDLIEVDANIGIIKLLSKSKRPKSPQ